jgi:hypothetical protein
MFSQTSNTPMQLDFSSENFERLKLYIQQQILLSSMGTKFYLEFPPTETPKDGIKRPSKTPENVYDVRFDEIQNCIICESRQARYVFQMEIGLLASENLTEEKRTTALAILAYLVEKASS